MALINNTTELMLSILVAQELSSSHAKHVGAYSKSVLVDKINEQINDYISANFPSVPMIEELEGEQ
jgi:hypothetical protein